MVKTASVATRRPDLSRKFFQQPANVAAFADPAQVGQILARHAFSFRTIRAAFPQVRRNFVALAQTDPAAADRYFEAVRQTQVKRPYGLWQLLAKLSTPLISRLGRIDPALQNKYIDFFLRLPVEYKAFAGEMRTFKPEYLPVYGEWFSLVREQMALSFAGTIPKIVSLESPQLDTALDIHLRMLYDEYTEVCEAAMFSFTTVLPALIRTGNPRAKQYLELAKHFIKDRNEFISGYAARALSVAARLYYDSDPEEFEEIVELLLRRARTNRVAYRRAAALNALARTHAFLAKRDKEPALRLRIVDVFRKNAGKLEHRGDSKQKILFQHDEEVVKFVGLLYARGDQESARQLVAEVIRSPHNLTERVPVYSPPLHIINIFRLAKMVVHRDGAESPILDELLGQVREVGLQNFHFYGLRFCLETAVLAKDVRPDYSRQLILDVVYHMKVEEMLYDQGDEAQVRAHYDIPLRVGEMRETVQQLVAAAEELGIPQLLVHNLTANLESKQVDNRRIGELRKLVTRLEPIDKELYLPFEYMLHGHPRPYHLSMLRFYIRSLKGETDCRRFWVKKGFGQFESPEEMLASDFFEQVRAKKEQLLPILEKMERILAAVYEVDPPKTRKTLMELSQSITDARFDALRKKFVYHFARNKVKAATFLGELMQRVSQLPSDQIATFDRSRLLLQLHYLGYGLFNAVQQDLGDNLSDDNLVTCLPVLRSQILAVQAMGFESPDFDAALEQIDYVTGELDDRPLDQKDHFDMLVAARRVTDGLSTVIDQVLEVYTKGVLEAARGREERCRRIDVVTDDLVRASLLLQLSEFSQALYNFLDGKGILAKTQPVLHELRSEASADLTQGGGAFTSFSPTKVEGMIITLARGGSAPLKTGDLEIWFERARQGQLELYVYEIMLARFGAAYLDGRRLSRRDLKSVLGIPASDSLLMSMWRFSD